MSETKKQEKSTSAQAGGHPDLLTEEDKQWLREQAKKHSWTRPLMVETKKQLNDRGNHEADAILDELIDTLDCIPKE